MRLPGGDLGREELTNDQCQSGAAVGKGDKEPAGFAQLAKDGFSVSGHRFGPDAVGLPR